MAREFLFGDLAGFRCDVAALSRYYHDVVAPTPAQPYHDNGADYVGWAVTSRDGTVADGVQQISLDPTKPQPKNALPVRAAVQPTPLCQGPVKEVIEALRVLGLKPFRVRIMALVDNAAPMLWHRDSAKESWRLHIPIVTNPGCFFDWKLDGGRVVRRHLPADGRAWLVRVDQIHRAVNEAPGGGTRVHLLMGLLDTPGPQRLGSEALRLPGLTPAA